MVWPFKSKFKGKYSNPKTHPWDGLEMWEGKYFRVKCEKCQSPLFFTSDDGKYRKCSNGCIEYMNTTGMSFD